MGARHGAGPASPNDPVPARHAAIFIRGISSLNTHSTDLIAYCMHTLRWPEVREAVLRLSEPQAHRRVGPGILNAVAPRSTNTVYGQGIDHIVMLQQADVLDYDDDENTSEVTRSRQIERYKEATGTNGRVVHYPPPGRGN